MPLVTVQEIVGVTPPVYIRKLPKKSCWGHADDALAARLPAAVDDGFKEGDDARYSVFLVENDDDLHRVLLGLNSTRQKLTERIPVVAFLPDELQSFGITMERTDGKTLCLHANQLHFDIIAQRDHLTALCEQAMSASRSAANVTKNQLKALVEPLGLFGCHAVGKSSSCQCEASLT